MFCVSIAQITVGFFAIDQLKLEPAEALAAAGHALTSVGIGLVCAQLIVRKLSWSPLRMIFLGALVSSVGFGAVAFATTSLVLDVCFFIAAAGMGWVFPASAALASNAVESHQQGAAAGAIGAAQGLGVVIGPLARTLLYEVNISIPYFLAASLLLGVCLWLLKPPA
ncbi:MFS transporter [Methylobacillus gramineus]|uniref:MFS transporter n=1 Tax=Methylobacillus gramineus TaxID=755169 RepID=UPI001CFFB674|nr:MFS transporter [Methylobacillus gramineus]MCB5185465.1 MFS transporter [Methylobacillus gramineus]